MAARLSALVLSGALLLGACSDDTSAPEPAQPIAELAGSAGLNQLVSALSYVDAELDAGLVDLFSANGTDYTVFAPNDAAFTRLYALLSSVLGITVDEISDLPAEVVLSVLQYHVTTGRQASTAVVPGSGERTITSLLGETFSVRANGTIRDGLTGLRDDASIVTADVAASNGVVHVIDQVIVPPTVVAALTAGGPADAALAPPGAASIAEVAINAGLTQLVAALTYVDEELGAGLVELFLNGRQQYTVFAPTDAAFTQLYGLLGTVLGATVDEVTDLPAEVVLSVLQYHVVEGRRAAVSVVPRRGERSITTLLGESFAARNNQSIRDGLTATGLRADAAITQANNSARNGVVHVIDQVLVPASVVEAITN